MDFFPNSCLQLSDTNLEYVGGTSSSLFGIDNFIIAVSNMQRLAIDLVVLA